MKKILVLSLKMKQFKGITYRTASNWKEFIKDEFIPIYYLEIGALHGANLISVANTYGKHPDSKMFVVDPWIDYKDYDEYIGEGEKNFNFFMDNIKTFEIPERKLQIFRNYSNVIVPQFPDESFDLIYIDGNHCPEYVLEDCVLSFRKLKHNGMLIIDDYGYDGDDFTKRGIDAFLLGFRDKLKLLAIKESQVFIIKL